jgi:ABC-type Fe3+/spermidine/putrescine transport system ATPase subunit
MSLLKVSAICKHFNHEPALNQVSLNLDPGSILCLLGPSGCGKTSLLRIIAGLEKADSGRVIFDGADMADVPPHRRKFGMMFQEFALFPHKNVFENIAFGLRMQRLPFREIERRTREMLNLVGLNGFERRNVSDLSGGERQRVALARSLAPRPRLLMLDEPLGSLDRGLRERLMPELRGILKKAGATAIFVTHDQAEAFAVGDIIAVMNKGRVEQISPPEHLYHHPATCFVARFLGFHNLLDGTVTADGIETVLGTLHLFPSEMTQGEKLTVLLRPDAATLENGSRKAASGISVCGRVKERTFQGRHYRLTMETEAGQILVFDIPNPPPAAGQRVRLLVHGADIIRRN